VQVVRRALARRLGWGFSNLDPAVRDIKGRYGRRQGDLHRPTHPTRPEPPLRILRDGFALHPYWNR
jgi:hypothetical protein